jgi:hypothetical protein
MVNDKYKTCWEMLKLKLTYDLAVTQKCIEDHNYDMITGTTEPTEIQAEIIYRYELILDEMEKIEKEHFSKPAGISRKREAV